MEASFPRSSRPPHGRDEIAGGGGGVTTRLHNVIDTISQCHAIGIALCHCLIDITSLHYMYTSCIKSHEVASYLVFYEINLVLYEINYILYLLLICFVSVYLVEEGECKYT